MTYISFIDYVPIPRFEGTPWTQIRIEESANPDGPWGNIEQFAINPLDADPKHPIARSFSTDNAVLDHGWYRVSFIDAAGNVLLTNPIRNSDDVAWRPSIADVGNIMMGRTIDNTGLMTGTFNATTQPTDDQENAIIDKAVRDLTPDLGENIPASLVQDAQNVVALRAAMFTELTYFGSEVATGRSPYPQYRDLFKESLAKLQSAIEIEEAGGDPADQISGNFPEFSFPPADDLWTRRM